MKVYVLEHVLDYEGTLGISLFDSREKAIRRLEKYAKEDLSVAREARTTRQSKINKIPESDTFSSYRVYSDSSESYFLRKMEVE